MKSDMALHHGKEDTSFKQRYVLNQWSQTPGLRMFEVNRGKQHEVNVLGPTDTKLAFYQTDHEIYTTTVKRTFTS
jgi:hypothetical protein